jgi:hypothetical protein
MGRVVNLVNSKTGELMPSIISIDRLTNDVIALRTEFIKIPDEIKGVKLNDEQKQTLMEGKPLYLEGMISKKERSFRQLYNSMRTNDMLSSCLTEATTISKRKRTNRIPNKAISKANRRKLQELSGAKNWMMSSTTSSKPDKPYTLN